MRVEGHIGDAADRILLPLTRVEAFTAEIDRYPLFFHAQHSIKWNTPV